MCSLESPSELNTYVNFKKSKPDHERKTKGKSELRLYWNPISMDLIPIVPSLLTTITQCKRNLLLVSLGTNTKHTKPIL